jgi:hypothetical protein
LNRIGLIEVPLQGTVQEERFTPGVARGYDDAPLQGTVQEERFTPGVARGYDDAPLQGADIHHPTGMLCLERLVDRFEQTRKNGGIAIADRDAGALRDALAVYEVGQEKPLGYRIEAGAYEDVDSDGNVLANLRAQSSNLRSQI